MFITPLLHNYRNSELLKFFNDTVTICIRYDPENLQLQNQVDDLIAKTAALDMTYKLNKGSEITKEMLNLDKLRDNDFVGLKTVVEGYTFHYDKSIRDAAVLIWNSIKKYGTDINRMNYQAETKNLDNLIREWENDSSLSAAISTLGQTAWVSVIKEDNQSFNERFLARVNEEAASPDVKIPVLRLEATMSYKQLVKHIDSRDTISEDGAYRGLVNEINVLVEKFNFLVAQRSSGNKSEDEGNGENSAGPSQEGEEQ